jgi:lysozyme family protein
MSQFDVLIPYILKHEGCSATNPSGFVDIPGDPGGVTKWGLSQREWSLLRVQPVYANYPEAVTDLDQAHAMAIYKTTYYLDVFDTLPPSVALIAFDCQVNEGNAIAIIQRAVGVNDDGQWGPMTLSAVKLALRNIPAFREDVLWSRVTNYDQIALKGQPQEHFLARLWIPRLLQCRAEAKLL